MAQSNIYKLKYEGISDLIDKYENSVIEKEQIDVLIEIALEIRMDEPEESLLLAEEIIDRSMHANYKSGLGNGYNHKGAAFWVIGEYEEGLDELTIALGIAKDAKDKDLRAKVLNNFGRIYRELGDLANSLKCFEESMSINQEIGNEINLAINLTNISNLYYDLGDYETALEYAEKCLPIFEKGNQIAKLNSIYQLLGNIYFKLEKFDKAELYFEKIIEIGGANAINKSVAESGLGKIHYKKGNFIAAKEYLQLALKHARESHSFETEIVSSFYLARMYLDTGETDKSLEIAIYGFGMAEEYQRKHDIMSFHEVLSYIYDKKCDIENAYHHLKKFESLKEQIFKQATLNRLRNLQIKNQIVIAKKEKEVAEKTAKLKEQFMANMSHEIRTPMNAIVGMVNILLNKEPRQDQLKYLNAIQKSSDNLLVIINDILDLSKIEAGKIILERIQFSLRALIHNTRETLIFQADEKHLDLNIEIDKNVPDSLFGDPTRLSQILINLIGNAIKFTDSGYVKLTVKCRNATENPAVIDFSVIDTGIGISEEHLQVIFSRFTQAGMDTTRKFGGTGLGLTISKQLVELMKGEIGVESVEGQGTTFWFQIPFDIDTQKVQESKTEVVNVNHLEDLKVMLVEDNEFNVIVAQDTLEQWIPSVQVTVAENGQQALDILDKKQDFDIIFMDIQMPVMDGLEAAKWIRANDNPKIANMKIIALTANVFEEDIKKYFKAGMNGYLTKPFQKEKMLSEIVQVLQETKDTTEKNNHNNQVAGEAMVFTELPERITDLTFIKSFANNNTEKVKKYISMFLNNAPKLLNDIRTGLENKDYEKIKIAAHSLKPQLSYMGVQEEISNVYLLEKSAGEKAHYHFLEKLYERLQLIIKKCLEELG